MNSGFEKLIENLQKERPAFYKYNHIYAIETSKIHDSLCQQLVGETGGYCSGTGTLPEVKKYNEKVSEIENDTKKKEEEMLKNYWGISENEHD